MGNNYFIVLQLPGSSELRFEDGKESPANFWANAASLIKGKKAKLLLQRRDTGISEELRKHVNTIKSFTTYLLFDITLNQDELQNEGVILKKAARIARKSRRGQIIDTDDKFQLITIDN